MQLHITTPVQLVHAPQQKDIRYQTWRPPHHAAQYCLQRLGFVAIQVSQQQRIKMVQRVFADLAVRITGAPAMAVVFPVAPLIGQRLPVWRCWTGC